MVSEQRYEEPEARTGRPVPMVTFSLVVVLVATVIAVILVALFALDVFDRDDAGTRGGPTPTTMERPPVEPDF